MMQVCRAGAQAASSSRSQLPRLCLPTQQQRQCPRRQQRPCGTHAQPVSQDVLAAAAGRPSQLATSAEDAHPEAWQACVQHLQGLGFDELDAAILLQRAFGWGARARAYWRHEKREEAPDLQQVQAVLAFLQGLGMDELQVCKAVKAFPEVLGCAVDSQLQGNVAKLQQEWKLEGDVLRGAVLRNPALLGYNVDCLGDCAGECNRCWVRF